MISRLNKKGFLLYELFIAFSFIIIIMIVMLQATITIKNQQQRTLRRDSVSVVKTGLFSTVGEDFEKYEIKSITGAPTTACTPSANLTTLTITFNNNGVDLVKVLTIDTVNKTATYDGQKIYLTGADQNLNFVGMTVTKTTLAGRISYLIKFDMTGTAYDFVVFNQDKNLKLQLFKNRDMGASHTLGTFNNMAHVENIVRDSNGGLHAVYTDDAAATRYVYYVSSTDGGCSWSGPVALHSTTDTLYQPVLKIDGNDKLHVLVQQTASDNGTVRYRSKAYGASWGSVVQVNAGHSSSDEILLAPTMEVDNSNNLHMIFDRAHLRGVGYRSFNGTSWTATSGVAAAAYDFAYNKTLVVGSDLHVFYTRSGLLYMTKRVSSAWTAVTAPITSFSSNQHDEIVDSNGDIWIFVTDQTTSPYRIYYTKFSTANNTYTPLKLLDSESGKHVSYPSATVDSQGNIYVAYSIYNGTNAWELFAKVYNKQTGSWSTRQQLTYSATDGSCVYPKFRWQYYKHADPDKIEFTYRQNAIGSSTYRLYYGSLNP